MRGNGLYTWLTLFLAFCVAVALIAWSLGAPTGCSMTDVERVQPARARMARRPSLPAYLPPRFHGRPQVKVWLAKAPAKPTISGAARCEVELHGCTSPSETVQRPPALSVCLIKGGFQLGDRRLKCRALNFVPEGDTPIEVSGRDYYGAIRIINAGGCLAVVNIVDAEQYVMGVVSGEMPASWPVEALKAQAVAARTYALYFQQWRLGNEWHIMSTTADQVYQGGRPRSRVREAVGATEGQVLMYRSGLFPAFYHSTCGGWTEPPGLALGRPQFDYLEGVPCPFCRKSPFLAWHAKIGPAELARKLKSAKIEAGNPITSVALVRPDERRLRAVRINWRGGEKTVSMSDFRRAVGRKKVRNARFACRFDKRAFVLDGHGFGHGAGMCQYGARGMAQLGYSYCEILAHYYRNTELAKVY